MSAPEVYFSTNLLTKVFLKKLPLLKLKYSWEISQLVSLLLGLSHHISTSTGSVVFYLPNIFMEMSSGSIFVILYSRAARCPEGEEEECWHKSHKTPPEPQIPTQCTHNLTLTPGLEFRAHWNGQQYHWLNGNQIKTADCGSWSLRPGSLSLEIRTAMAFWRWAGMWLWRVKGIGNKEKNIRPHRSPNLKSVEISRLGR